MSRGNLAEKRAELEGLLCEVDVLQAQADEIEASLSLKRSEVENLRRSIQMGNFVANQTAIEVPSVSPRGDTSHLRLNDEHSSFLQEASNSIDYKRIQLQQDIDRNSQFQDELTGLEERNLAFKHSLRETNLKITASCARKSGLNKEAVELQQGIKDTVLMMKQMNKNIEQLNQQLCALRERYKENMELSIGYGVRQRESIEARIVETELVVDSLKKEIESSKATGDIEQRQTEIVETEQQIDWGSERFRLESELQQLEDSLAQIAVNTKKMNVNRVLMQKRMQFIKKLQPKHKGYEGQVTETTDQLIACIESRSKQNSNNSTRNALKQEELIKTVEKLDGEVRKKQNQIGILTERVLAKIDKKKEEIKQHQMLLAERELKILETIHQERTRGLENR